MTDDLEVKKLKLKVQALAERLAQVTTESENRVADLRVEITLLTEENQQLREQIPSDTPEVVEGEVVDG